LLNDISARLGAKKGKISPFSNMLTIRQLENGWFWAKSFPIEKRFVYY